MKVLFLDTFNILDLIPGIAFIFFFFATTWIPIVNDSDYPKEDDINDLQEEKVDRDGEIPMTGTFQMDMGAPIVSANPLVPGADGNTFHVTATNNFATINAAQSQVGTIIVLIFDAILTMTHHATDLILPGGANITTAAGDRSTWVEEVADEWRCISYIKADGTAVVASTPDFSDGGEVGGAKRTLGNTDANILAFITNNVDGIIISAAGEVTMPLTPSFSATKSAPTASVTGDATVYTIIPNTEVVDQSGDYNNANGVFTASITGNYLLKCLAALYNLAGTSKTYLQLTIFTSNRVHSIYRIDSDNIHDGGNTNLSGATLADMDAADTAYVTIQVGGGGKDVGVNSASDFSGVLEN